MVLLNEQNLLEKLSKFLGSSYEPVYDKNGLPSKIKKTLTNTLFDVTTQFDRNTLIRTIFSDLTSLGIDTDSSESISKLYVSKMYDNYKKAVLEL
jgi:hypothetical protein